MKTGLTKKAQTGTIGESEVRINVFDLHEKGKILFTGNISEVANFIGSPYWSVISYLRTKARYKKKYALRYAKQGT